MNHRKITLVAFCSVKGGVGKSALSTMAASFFQRRGQSVLVLDCDFLGTSLADGLPLMAPRIPVTDDGWMRPDAEPTNDWLSRGETIRLRDLRADGTDHHDPSVAPPPFLNDVAHWAAQHPNNSHLLSNTMWKHEGVGRSPFFLPSSSLIPDVDVALQGIFHDGGERWANNIAFVLRHVAVFRQDISVVILDLPPGIYAFSQQLLGVLVRLKHKSPMSEGGPSDLGEVADWAVRPYLVLSQDRGDLYVGLEVYANLLRYDFGLVPLLNRHTEAPTRIRQVITQRFAHGPYRHERLEQTLVMVGEHPGIFGQLFLGGGLVGKEVPDDLGEILAGQEVSK